MAHEPRPDEALEQLQRVARELIGAARAFLDLAEDVVDHPGPLRGVVTTVADFIGTLAARARAAADNAGPATPPPPPPPPPSPPPPAEDPEGADQPGVGATLLTAETVQEVSWPPSPRT